MRQLNGSDHELIGVAKTSFDKMPQSSSVVSILRDTNGEIFTGYNLYKKYYGGAVCGEVAAFVVATTSLAPENVKPELVVSLKRTKDDRSQVVNSCGNCLQKFKDTYPDFEIIIAEAGGLAVAKVSELLPYGYNEFRINV